MREHHRARFAVLFLVILIVKLLLLLLDSEPSFHFGDSGAYLATATSKWIPPDRSFVYGFLLRPIILATHSLLFVVVLQTFLSGVASWIVAWCLFRYFGTGFGIAGFYGVMNAIEPLQLMSERFIMTESLATFGFALLIWWSLSYLEKGRISGVILVQLVGVVLVSLRYSFLPLVLVLSVAVPLLSVRSRERAILGLLVAVSLSQGLLLGYRHLYGFLAHQPAAYLSRDGDFLIADVAPLIEPSDFPDPKKRKAFFDKVTIPRRDPDLRRSHRWLPGGLCDSLLQVANGDELVANRLAKKTALTAIKRDPLGVMKLGAFTWGQFYRFEKLKWMLRLDQGQFVQPTPDDVKMLTGWFGIDPRQRTFTSLTKRWEESSALWCSLMVSLPVLYAFELAVHWRQATRYDLLCLLSAWVILATSVIPVEIANPRYLTPLPWLAVLILGSIGARLGNRLFGRRVTEFAH